MDSRDINAILAIQIASPEAAQWIASDYDVANRPATCVWIAEQSSQTVGFIVLRHVLDEVEILNIAVHHHSRRQGVAAELLRVALQWAAERGAKTAYLEVRPSNTAAIRFYERHSFRASGRRTRYYSSPAEDAVILVSELRKI